jgi:dTDP-4-amino-4,6-dideoxygalactose transaminase
MAHGLGPGDEVIVPSFSFFATASSVVATGATPIFADIEPTTYCLSVEAAEAAITPRTKAILPVHLYGLPADMPRFEEVCRRYGLALLEDAAQAHGAAIGARTVGSWGTAAFSFFPTKNMTTSEGGIVLTSDERLAERLRRIRHQGMDADYSHEIMGYNFRMTEIEAAIGLVQLGRLHEWVRTRQRNAAYYDRHLHNVVTPALPAGRWHAYHQYTVRVPPHIERNLLVQHLNESGIGARVYYPIPIHRQPVFLRRGKGAAPDLPHTDAAAREVLSLPVHPGVSEAELEYIVERVNSECA